jgi:hypothetical protein
MTELKQQADALKANMDQDAIMAEYMSVDSAKNSVYDFNQVSRYYERIVDVPPPTDDVAVFGVFVDPNGGGVSHSVIKISRLFSDGRVVVSTNSLIHWYRTEVAHLMP